MSKENANLRLLGSPVSLSYRNKKKEDRKNVRNRPRSAINNSCITQDHQERSKRPFSADTKDRGPSTRSFFKVFSADLLESYNNSPTATSIKVVAPTLDILRDNTITVGEITKKNKELCSNASDYGSEDTFISLGTKIKARAQLSPKPKITNPKNLLKYRTIARKSRRLMDATVNEESRQTYGMEVKITERSPSPTKSKHIYDHSSSQISRGCESYFVPLEQNGDLGRVSLGIDIDTEVEQAIVKYSRRLAASKQQLSLVEEESTQDVESGPSQNLSSLSPENSLEGQKNNGEVFDDLTGRKTYVVDDIKIDYGISNSSVRDPRTYTHFYDDFQTDPYKCQLSSTVVHTDSSSKDSGYPDSGPNEQKFCRQNYSLPTTSVLKKTNVDKVEDQPKSLDSISTNSSDKSYRNIVGLNKNIRWTEPLNHSRLLYKDFFIKKEGHIAIPPQNSPSKQDANNCSETNGDADTKVDIIVDDSDYPSYLVNSSTKVYTSKVIEDYKRELETINNLHELTLKDIKADAISPTPLNIDKMFEEYSNVDDTKKDDVSTNNREIKCHDRNKNSLDSKKRDVSKISTKELIQNYFKVKEGDYKGNLPKGTRKKSNITPKDESTTHKQEWNNKTLINSPKSIPVIRNQTQKNVFTMRTPLSARIESVQNDKDVDSWMSLTAPSPTMLEINEISLPTEEAVNTEVNLNYEQSEDNPTPSPPPVICTENDTQTVKELSTNSTVLDIYSMLKEIESYGDNPVSVAKFDAKDEKVTEEKSLTPKDNFMEIFEFLEKVEQSANDALSVVTNTTPQTLPKLESLLKLPQTELAQRLVTASLQLEERSCCIALLQESLANHKEQMIQKVSNLEKQSHRNIAKVKQECEETIKRHQSFIDQLINDKKTLNHRIEQLVDERRSAEERWKRSAQVLEERYKLELRNQHDKMAAAQQVARQRWVRQKAEKIKELTVKGLEGELREMAERQQKEISDLKMRHAEQLGKSQAKHAQELEDLRRLLEEEKEAALVKERQLASSRLEKQILELEVTYQEQRTRLVAEMRAENERVATELAEKEKSQREELASWKREQEKILEEARQQLDKNIAVEKEKMEEQLKQQQKELDQQFEQYKKEYEAEQQMILKKKVTEISAQHKQERDREIERAIESMEAEAQAGRKELQEALRRNKEQYEAELKELAETEQATLRRYQEAQHRVRNTEDTCAELEVTISQLETRNRLLTEKNTQLESLTEEVRASCEQSWQQVVDNLNKEMEQMKHTHEEQMHQLYAKVKVAVARKDSAIQALTRESAKYQEKITLLEQKLQQQRKDFLKHK